ncbi:hypothetical protein [Polaribacter sp.]|uniref:hypothetical protein n=1 Tax=Polaribacter sp. TaxID=1920175 RepID=UPI003EF72B64
MDTKLNNNIKLEEISTQYSKFDKNQVLTETQLNNFLDYFDDQNRLSRTSLSGVGIACGFNLSYTKVKVQLEGEFLSEYRLNISQGRGVTTDGDLLLLQKELPVIEGRDNETLKTIDFLSKSYGYYKKYTDNNANYAHFIGDEENQISLWELSENQDENGTLKRIEDFSNIEEMVVLLYLESYSKQADLCSSQSCDNQGLVQVANLKVLLVSLDDAKYLVSKDAIYNQHNWFEIYQNLPEVQAKRIVLSSKNTETYKKLKESYYKEIKNNDTLKNLVAGLNSIYAKFKITSVTPRINNIFNFSSNLVPFDFQYRYDVLKDIIDTYNEIKELLLHLNVDCCPNIGAFPKHLLLGKIKEKEAYLSYRHQFYKSPIIGHEDENYLKVISLLQRVKVLAFNYRTANKGETIEITPSKIYTKLQDRAIPFYYNVNESFLTQWSFLKTSNLKEKYNLSYHKENLAKALSIQSPLDYNLDGFNFYRIEGHQGKMYRDALESIFKIREEKGLSFDVKALSINTSKGEIDINKYKCQFEDLSVLLSAWKAEQNCILTEISSFLSGFSTVNAGVNVVAVAKGYENKFRKASSLTEMVDATSKTSAKIESTVTSKERLTTVSDKVIVNQKDLLRKNIVEEGLTKEKDTIGQLLEAAFQENKKGSAHDILAYFDQSTSAIKKEESWAADAELTDFVFREVPQILVHTYLLDNKIPSTILQIDNITLSNYQLTIKELCVYVKELQANYQSKEIEEGSKQIVGLLINQLSTVCCSGKKLELLLTEIDKRKQEILMQIQLSEFVKNHPGLEHKAGVKPGGTFVMVYLSEDEKDQEVYEDVMLELDFLEQPNIDDDGLDGDEGVIQLWNSRISTKFAFLHRVTKYTQNPVNEVVFIGKDIAETVSNLASFLNNIWTLVGEKSVVAKADGKKLIIVISGQSIKKYTNYIQFYNPSIVGKNQKIYFEENATIVSGTNTKNKVVADFCLPFMFKSDCSPINFIIPKEPVFLRLPSPYVCLKDSEEFEPMVFVKSDNNLEIKANVSEGIESGLTKNEKGADIFDARLTDDSLYGKVIEFTLDDQETECNVTVYADVSLSVTREITYNEAKTIATVTYKVSEIIPNITYAWDFGKGNVSGQRPDKNGEIAQEYELPFNNSNTIKPTLTITNGLCEKQIPIADITFEKPIDASLDIQKNYCLDPQLTSPINVPFTNINPTGGKIEIVGNGIEGLKIDADQLFILPEEFRAFDQRIRFTIDGFSTTAVITIGTIVTASFTYKIEGKTLILTNTSDLAEAYLWNIDGTETKTRDVKEVIERKLTSFDSEVIKVSLVAIATCMQEIPFEQTITLSEENETTCIDEVRNSIIKDRTKLSDNIDVSQDIMDNIILPTMAIYDKTVVAANEVFEGSKNNEILPAIMRLFSLTADEMPGNKEKTHVFGELSKSYIAQTKLIFNILHCQPHEVLEKDTDLILNIIEQMKLSFGKFKKNQLVFDLENDLKAYLKAYSEDAQVIEYIQKGIKESLIPVIE